MRREAPARVLRVRHVEDPGEWNELVKTFPRYDAKQAHQWAAVRAEHGWGALRVAAFDGDEPGAVCQVLVRRIRGLGALLYAPRGPLYRGDDPEALASLVAELRRLGRRTAAILLRASPAIPHDEGAAAAPLADVGFVPLPDEWTTWNTPRYVQLLDVRPPESELLRRMRSRYRQYVRAAARRGLVVEASRDHHDLARFYDLMVNLGRLKGFPIREVRYYERLLHHYGEDAELVVARAGHELAGALLVARFGRRAAVLYSSVRSGAAEHDVAPALFWECVRRVKARGCEVIDFGGTGVQLPPQKSDAGYGVYHFKAGLGAELNTYVPFHDLVFRPVAYTAFRLAERQVLPRIWEAMARRPGRMHWRLLRSAA